MRISVRSQRDGSRQHAGHAPRNGFRRAPRKQPPVGPAPLQVPAPPSSARSNAVLAVNGRRVCTQRGSAAPPRAAAAATAEAVRAREGLPTASAPRTPSRARVARTLQQRLCLYAKGVARVQQKPERGVSDGPKHESGSCAPRVPQALQNAVKKRLVRLSRRPARALRAQASESATAAGVVCRAAPLAAAPATKQHSSAA